MVVSGLGAFVSRSLLTSRSVHSDVLGGQIRPFGRAGFSDSSIRTPLTARSVHSDALGAQIRKFGRSGRADPFIRTLRTLRSINSDSLNGQIRPFGRSGRPDLSIQTLRTLWTARSVHSDALDAQIRPSGSASARLGVRLCVWACVRASARASERLGVRLCVWACIRASGRASEGWACVWACVRASGRALQGTLRSLADTIMCAQPRRMSVTRFSSIGHGPRVCKRKALPTSSGPWTRQDCRCTVSPRLSEQTGQDSNAQDLVEDRGPVQASVHGRGPEIAGT